MTPCPTTAMIEVVKHPNPEAEERTAGMTSRQVDAAEFYKFRVKDHLEDGWFRMFPGLSVKNVENGEVLITGWLVGPAAMHHVLERIRNLNLILISAERIERSDG